MTVYNPSMYSGGLGGIPIYPQGAPLPLPPSENVDYLYQDKGCEHSPTCLACTLPVCKYDAPPMQVNKTADRDAKVLSLIEAGLSASKVAKRLGITPRTVFRSLARQRKEE